MPSETRSPTARARYLNWLSALALSATTLLTMPVAQAAGRYATGQPPRTPCRTSIGGTTLTARFWATEAATVSSAYGDDAVIAGTLTTADGAPLANATLEVEELLIGAGATLGERIAVPRIGFVRTAADGSYAYRLPAGPNREAIVTYRGGDTAASCALRYFAAAQPTLSIAPRRARNRGRPIRFWGRLPGPQAAGHVLILQVERGDGWITFRRMTTDREGRYQASYGFHRTFQPTRFTFRALVPRQAAYPWLQGTSRLVPVVVYPG